MKKVALLAMVMACSLGGYAQQESAQPADKRVEYFTADGQLTPAGSNVAYRQETEVLADGGESVRTFYPNGVPRSVTFFKDAAHKQPRGVAEYWYENGGIKSRYTYETPDRQLEEQFYGNGQLHFKMPFVKGKLQGELVTYYPNGELKRRDIYAQSELVSGARYDDKGLELPHTPFEVGAVYPGGQEALFAYVIDNTQYPAEALRLGQEGEVRVKFIVDTTGQVTQVHIGQGVSPLLDEEALRVVLGFARFKPGRQDDRPASMYFTVPIKFSVSAPRRTRKGRTKPR